MGLSLVGTGKSFSRQRKSVALLLAAAAGASGIIPAVVRADTFTWDNTAGNWSDAAHWGGTAPASNPANTLVFGSGAADYTSAFNLATGFQLNALNLSADAGRYDQIAGPTQTATLDFVANGATAPSINMTGGGTFRIGNNLRVANGQTLAVNATAGSSVVFAASPTPNTGTVNHLIAPVSTTAGFTPITTTFDGGGTFVVESLTNVGLVNVNNGLLVTDRDGDFFGGATRLNIGAAGVVDTGGFGEAWGSFSGSAGAVFRGTVSVSGVDTGTFRYDGVITNRAAGGVAISGFGTAGGTTATNRALTKAGGHTLIVSGASTYSGATTISGGTLVYAGDPVTSTTTKGFASGTITSSPFGLGTVTLSGGTLSIDAANRTIVNAVTSTASTSSFIDIPAGGELTTTGLFTHNGTLTKIGAGTWRHGGTGAATLASILNINAGLVLLNDVTGGDMNTATINVNSGGSFQFGSNPQLGGSENPDHPGTTYFNLNTGGNVVWNVGESIGGFNFLGGTVSLTGSIGLDGATASEWQSGTATLASGAPAFNGAQTINKTTAGTVTLSGIPLSNTGGLNIQDGVLATDSTIASVSGGNPITAPVTFGTDTTNGTLRYTGTSATANLTRAVTLNAGGGTLDVADPAAVLTFGGTTAGPGRLTKAGAGTLVLTGSANHTGGTTISGGTLSVGAGTAAGSLAGNVVNNGSLVFNRSDDLSFAGNVSGTGGLTKLGAGTANLTGALSYGGPTTVSAGTLRIAPANLAGAVTVADTATLAVANPATAGTLTVPTLSLGGGGTTLRLELNQSGNPTNPLVNVTATNGLNLNGGTHTLAVSNQGALSVGTFTLVDYAGAAITSGFNLAPLPARTQGSLVFDAANTRINLNVTGSDSIKWNGNVSTTWDAGSAINVGGTLNFKLASNSSATNFVQNDVAVFDDSAAGATTVDINDQLQPAAVTVNNAAKAYTFQGPGGIAGGASLTKAGTGTLTVLTNNSYAGGTTVSGGTLNIGNGGSDGTIGTGPLVNNGTVVWNRGSIDFAAPISGSGTIVKSGGSSMNLTGPLTGTGSLALEGGSLNLTTSADYVYDGAVTGAGSLTKTGTGTVTLAGNNTYAGGTTINSGTLQIGNGGNSGTLAGNVSINGLDQAGGGLVFSRTGSFTYAGNIDSSGRIVNAGAGNVTLAGVITQNIASGAPGTIVAQAGTLTLANPNTGGIFGTVTANSGATVALDTTTGDQTYANVFSGQGTVAKVGPGTVTLTANNNPFTGTVRVDAGRLVLADPTIAGGDLGALAVVVNDGAAFQFGQGGITGENPDFPDTSYVTANAGGTIEWRVGENIGGINLMGGTLLFNGGNITSNGSVPEVWASGTVTSLETTSRTHGGTAVINKTTPGTVTVSGPVVVSNAINIQDGTLAFAAVTNLTGALTFGTAGAGGTAGTLEYQGPSATKAGTLGLTGAGGVRVTQAATNFVLSGIVSGSGAFTKSGPGTLTLTGVNTNSGGVTVAAGRLLANSTAGTGAVSVSAGATLGGTGTIAGPLTLAGAASAVAPGGADATTGDSLVGLLAVTKTVAFNAGGELLVQLAAAASGTPVAGTDFDQLIVRGAGTGVTIADGAVLRVLAAGPVPDGQAFRVVDQTVGTAVAGSFRDPAGNLLSEGSVFTASGQSFAISYAGGDVTLYAGTAVVPEPTSALLAAAAGGLLLLRRRRRAR